MAGVPNGTAGTVAGCYPYYAEVAGDAGSYVCVVSVTQGVRAVDPGACTYSGFVARPTQGVTGDGPMYACVAGTEALPADVVAAKSGAAQCSSVGFGYSSAPVTVQGNSRTDLGTCTGTKAPLSVADSGATSALQSFASANHADLSALSSSSPSASASQSQYAPQAFAVEPVLEALFLPVLFALLIAALWSMWTRVAR